MKTFVIVIAISCSFPALLFGESLNNSNTERIGAEQLVAVRQISQAVLSARKHTPPNHNMQLLRTELSGLHDALEDLRAQTATVVEAPIEISKGKMRSTSADASLADQRSMKITKAKDNVRATLGKLRERRELVQQTSNQRKDSRQLLQRSAPSQLSVAIGDGVLGKISKIETEVANILDSSSEMSLPEIQKLIESMEIKPRQLTYPEKDQSGITSIIHHRQ